MNPYHRWLGLPPELMRPTYYELLGITPGEQSPDRIAAAADNVLARLQRVDAGQYQRLHDELCARIERARQTLVDPSRRARYDERLKRQQHETPPTTSAETVDPMAPVIFGTSRDAGELDDLPAAMPPPPAIADAAPNPMAPVSFPQLGATAGPAPRIVPQAVASARSGAAPASGELPAFPSAADRSLTQRAAVRHKSSHYTPLLTILATTSLLVIIGLVYYLAAGPDEEEVLTGPSPDLMASAAMRRAAVDAGPKMRSAIPPVSIAEDEPAAVKRASSETPAALESEPSARPAMVAENDLPQTSAPEPTPEQLEQLGAALRAAHDSLRQRDFERVAVELQKAEALPQRPQDRAKVDRLQQLANHVGEFLQAIDDALAGFEAGETIQVGNSTVVNVVEVTSDTLVIRLLGMNRRYALQELPPGLAMAIAKHELPADSPQTKVIGGAYLATLPTADTEDLAQVRAWWQEAAAADRSVQSLIPVLDDSYELSP